MASGARSCTRRSQSAPQSTMTRRSPRRIRSALCRRCRRLFSSMLPRVPRKVILVGAIEAYSAVDRHQNAPIRVYRRRHPAPAQKRDRAAMTIRNLEFLFKPKSVALIGASKRPGSVGALVARNLFRSGFDGPVMPVNPKYDAIERVLAYPDVDSLPLVPDLAVIATPPETVPGLVAALAERGTKGVVVITAGFGE